jgi:hypothetical protein
MKHLVGLVLLVLVVLSILAWSPRVTLATFGSPVPTPRVCEPGEAWVRGGCVPPRPTLMPWKEAKEGRELQVIELPTPRPAVQASKPMPRPAARVVRPARWRME